MSTRTSIRDVEQRLVKLQQRPNCQRAGPRRRSSSGLGRHTQSDRRALAADVRHHRPGLPTDRSRVATLLLTNNLSGQVYPFLGLRQDHHNFSHNWQNKEFASITRVSGSSIRLSGQEAGVDPGGERTVLDNSCILLANEQ